MTTKTFPCDRCGTKYRAEQLYLIERSKQAWRCYCADCLDHEALAQAAATRKAAHQT